MTFVEIDSTGRPAVHYRRGQAERFISVPYSNHGSSLRPQGRQPGAVAPEIRRDQRRRRAARFEPNEMSFFDTGMRSVLSWTGPGIPVFLAEDPKSQDSRRLGIPAGYRLETPC